VKKICRSIDFVKKKNLLKMGKQNRFGIDFRSEVLDDLKMCKNISKIAKVLHHKKLAKKKKLIHKKVEHASACELSI
jgi:hypothetical protein